MRLLFSLATLSFALSSPFLLADDNTEELTKDHREFALSLYPVLDTADDNLIFSPYSIASCLSMVYVGARGETAMQMQSVLHLKVDRKSIGKTTSALGLSLQPKKKEDTNYQLNIANALWVDQGIFLLTDFRYVIEQQFNAKLGILNFTQSANALTTINQWVAQQTENKIPSLLAANDINALTRLVLTNAVYFKGSWVYPFDPKATKSAPFHPTPDTTITVQMMPQLLFAPYYENELVQAIALPFVGTSNSGGKLAYVVLLPKSADNFADVFEELSESFDSWISSLKMQQIDLKMPKFSLSNRYDLNAPLAQLGMEDAFDSDANFTGIDGMRDLFLNKVVHEAFFDLDENGITAAAATAAGMNAKGAKPPEAPTVMNVDHPFLFFIVDLNTQEMLFMGKMAQPGNSQ
jgi:serpin B